MPVPVPSSFRMKAAVSVTDMAKAVGLSRSRFYDYVRRGVFPTPLYSLTTKRPYYNEEMQDQILTTRQRGVTTAGEYVLFYERRTTAPTPALLARRPSRPSHAHLLDELRSLGLVNVTATQVEAAVATLYSSGVSGVDEATVLRAVYRHLRRQNAGG